MSRASILIAGGGTGGHVFPAVAVAEAIESMADVDVVFCGTARGIEARVIPARGWHLELLAVEPIKGGGPLRAIRGVLVAARATLQALSVVRRLRPRAVLSVGGYASGPATLAAAVMGVPVAVLEPNSVPGLTNRLLAPIARRAYLAWDEARPAFREATTRSHGVPLRAGFAGARPYAPGGLARVLVMGGSQGAAVLNERVPEAIALARAGRLARRPFEVVHQAGRDRDDAVRASYARAGVTGVTVVPFIDDVAGAIADADLVVARAGAGTIAEITAVGRAAVLVPFPHAADDHQARNAEALARSGAAVCLRQETAAASRLAAEIEHLLGDEAARVAMAAASRALGRPDAARRVAEDLLALASVPDRASGGGGVRGLAAMAGPATGRP